MIGFILRKVYKNETGVVLVCFERELVCFERGLMVILVFMVSFICFGFY